MHMISKKDLSDAEMDTLTKSCSPTIVITANGDVQTHEEAIVYVKELDIFQTMKVLEKTPSALSLGKLCDTHGYSYEWINGQKPHLIQNSIRIQLQHRELRSDRGSWFINDFFLKLVYLNTHDIFNRVKQQWDDTTENKKYISSVLDLFSIPNLFIRKGRPHGHRYGKKASCREFHTAKQLQKRCRKKQYENIHDRFIRDMTFRKTMI